MTHFLDPSECRARALRFANHSLKCASPVARERFASIARNWINLALQMEAGSGRDNEKSDPAVA
jgi:hypothetical protein